MQGVVTPLHPVPGPPENDEQSATDTRRERAAKLIERYAPADVKTLGTAVIKRCLTDLLLADDIPVRSMPKVIEAVHQMVRLESGEATKITRDEALAAVEQLRHEAKAKRASGQPVSQPG